VSAPKKPRAESVRVLAVLKRGPRTEVRLELVRFAGLLRLDCRNYIALAGGAPCPTLKGVGFRIEELQALRDAVDAAIRETSE
jgi:hypothetical protein